MRNHCSMRCIQQLEMPSSKQGCSSTSEQFLMHASPGQTFFTLAVMSCTSIMLYNSSNSQRLSYEVEMYSLVFHS